MKHCRPGTGILIVTAALLTGCASSSRPVFGEIRTAKGATPPYVSRDEGVLADEYEADLEQRVQAEAKFAAGVLQELNEEPDKALKSFAESVLADPDHQELAVEVARRYLREKQPQKAIEVLARAARSPDAAGQVHTLLGVAYGEAGSRSQAIREYRAAIKKTPLDIFPYRGLADLYLKEKRPKEAVAVMEEAAGQSKADAAFLIGLCEGLAECVKFPSPDLARTKDLAIKMVDRARKAVASDPTGLQHVAELYEAFEKYTQAEEIYLDLLKRFPVAGVLRGKLTGLYLRSGNKDRARDQLESIARDNPANPNAHYLLGSLWVEEKKYDQAAEEFERALKLRPDMEEVYYDLAGVRLALNHPEQALEVMSRARVQFDKKFLTEFYSGLAAARLKRYDDALKYFHEAEATAKASEPARLTHLFYFQVGSLLERKGDWEEAEKYIQKSLEISPSFAEGLNYLGYMWADKGVKLSEARKLIEKALQLEPKNAAYLDSMGWVLFKLKIPREALSFQLKAVENSEEPDATIFDHLGDIYAALKEQPKARDAWEKSLKLEASEEVKKKLDAAK